MDEGFRTWLRVVGSWVTTPTQISRMVVKEDAVVENEVIKIDVNKTK